MKANEIRALCGEELTNELLEEINPLRIHESIEFNRRHADGDYRDRAIAAVINSRVPFSSTCNCAYELMKMFVSVKCPHCGGATTVQGGGGNSAHYTTEYRCNDCATSVHITIPNNGFGITPKK